MSSLVAQKSQPSTLSDQGNINNNDNSTSIEVQDDPVVSLNSVTSHVYIKPAHSNGTLDKEVVLRRIRQRKRVNKLRAALQRLFGSPVSSKTDNAPIKWVDNAFAAL